MKQNILTILFLFVSFILFSQESQKIKDLESKRKLALEEIEATNKLLDKTKKTTATVLNRLNLLTQKIVARKKLIESINEEAQSLDEEIQMMDLNIQTLEKDINFKKESYAELLRKMQLRKKTQDNFLFIFSAKNFAQSYRRVRYLKEYAIWQKSQTQEIVEKQKVLTLQKEKVVQRKEEKLKLLAESQKENQKLQVEENTQKQEVADLKKQQKTLQAELDKKKRQAADLNRQIDKIISDQIAKAEQEARLAAQAQAKREKERKIALEKQQQQQKKPQEKKQTKEPDQKIETAEVRVAETKGGYAMTKEERKLSGSFVSNKGRLPFPLRGSYKITGHYGQHDHPELKYVKVYNNGIEVQTTPGNEACVVFDGEVTAVFVMPGYNYSVIVRHGNYLTVYSNLINVKVKQGSKVKTGQTIGTIFTDSEKGNVTILYFEIRKERDKLNPEAWLNR